MNVLHTYSNHRKNLCIFCLLIWSLVHLSRQACSYCFSISVWFMFVLFLLLGMILKTEQKNILSCHTLWRDTSPYLLYEICISWARSCSTCMNAFSTCASILSFKISDYILFWHYFECILVSVCVCVHCLSLFCLLPPLSPFHCRQDGKLFPPRRSGGCDLSYFRLSITSRTTTSLAFIRMLSVWVCTSVSILVIACSIFKHTEVLSHKLHGETRETKAPWWVSLQKIDGGKDCQCVCLCVCEDFHVVGDCLRSCFTHRPCLP